MSQFHALAPHCVAAPSALCAPFGRFARMGQAFGPGVGESKVSQMLGLWGIGPGRMHVTGNGKRCEHQPTEVPLCSEVPSPQLLMISSRLSSSAKVCCGWISLIQPQI